MPSKLENAYGGSWGNKRRGENSRCTAPLCNTPQVSETPAEKPVGASVKKPRIKPLGSGSNYEMHSYTNQSSGRGGGDYVLHITIDQQDCHLLCLFIGVFTLSILLNKSSKSGSPPFTL